MQMPYSGSYHYSYADSDSQTNATNTPTQSPAYPTPYGLPQHQGADQVKREKRKYRCRKRSPATIERARVVRRDKANARERRRMNSLNDALEHLRTILPSVPDEPKMTKIETLRVAQGYITYLASVLSDADNGYQTLPEHSPYPSPAYPTVWPNKVHQ